MENRQLDLLFNCCFWSQRPKKDPDPLMNHGNILRPASTPWTWRKARSTTCSWPPSLGPWPPRRGRWRGSSWPLLQFSLARSPPEKSSPWPVQHAVSFKIMLSKIFHTLTQWPRTTFYFLKSATFDLIRSVMGVKFHTLVADNYLDKVQGVRNGWGGGHISAWCLPSDACWVLSSISNKLVNTQNR